MVPTLNGRIQTRIAVLAVVGGLWTLLITPLLPDGAPLSASYRATFQILLLAIGLGVLWELLYHFIQQFRWEKDWPTFLGLVTVVNEGLLIWILIKTTDIGPDVGFGSFLLHFLTVWIVVWLVVNGPMRIPFVRWRFLGGRLI